MVNCGTSPARKRTSFVQLQGSYASSNLSLFPFFSSLNFMDSSYKIADLDEFWVTKSEALRDIIPLNTVKSQKSVYLSLKTRHLQCVLSMTTSAICLCLADGRVSAEICQISCWWMFHTEQRCLLCLCSSALSVVSHKFFTALSPRTVFEMLSPTAESAGNVAKLH